MSKHQHLLRWGEWTIEISLCDTGESIHREWTHLLEAHAGPEPIYNTTRDYFLHRNGVRCKDGKFAIEPCRFCQVVAISREVKHEDINSKNSAEPGSTTEIVRPG